MSEPISIVTINFNNRVGLRRTLESLARQADKAFELVVVDGGSTDGSLEECANHQDMIKTVIAEPDRGIYDAWNKGIAASAGQLVGLLNSGDEYHPNTILTIREHLRTTGGARPRSILCGRTYIISNGEVRKVIGNVVSSALKFGIGVAHPATFIPRDVYAALGGYENISIASDAQFLLRCIRHDVRFEALEFKVFMEAGGISQRLAIAGFRQYARALTDLHFCSRIQAEIIWIAYAVYKTASLLAERLGLLGALANGKHLLVRMMNVGQRLAFAGPLRRLVLWLLGFEVNPSAFVSPFAYWYRTGRFSIGAGSVVNREVGLDNRGGISIGRGCSISHSALLTTAGHDIDSPYFEYFEKSIWIGDHVAIFSRAVVLPGARLENGVVVLAGAVISGGTVENGVYGGVPAKFLRLRICEPRHRFAYFRSFAL